MRLVQQRIAQQFTVGRRGLAVLLVVDRCGYSMGWREADALAARIRASAEEEPGCIRLDLPERTFLVPVLLANEMRTALVAKSREVEEQEKAETIAFDAAILARAGARFGLSNDTKIQHEARKLATWDTGLRRALPLIESLEVFGAPTITVHEPRTP